MHALTRSMTGPIRSLSGILIAAPLAALLVGGCVATSTDRAALDQARAALERARSEPRVRALAAAELDRAEVAWERAQAAAKAGAPAHQVDHLAYLASQQAGLAKAHARDRVAQSEIEVLKRALGPSVAGVPVEDAEQKRTAADVLLATPTDTASLEFTLDLSELAFEDAEPSRETVSKLGGMAERLLGEPGRTVSIEADFGLPDPVARNIVERRIETVRAAFLRRGIEASRIIVRAGAPPEGQGDLRSTKGHAAPE